MSYTLKNRNLEVGSRGAGGRKKKVSGKVIAWLSDLKERGKVDISGKRQA